MEVDGSNDFSGFQKKLIFWFQPFIVRVVSLIIFGVSFNNKKIDMGFQQLQV